MPQTVAIGQGPHANTHHCLQGYMISKVWVGHPRLERLQLVFFDLGLAHDVVHKAKSLKTGDLLPNTNPTISWCVITGKPFKSSEPQFLPSTYPPTYPSIHPSIFYLHLSQQVVVKRKRGSIKRESLWKLQMHKLIAIVQMMIDGQGLRAWPKLGLSIVWEFLGFEARVRQGAWARGRWLPG